MQNIRPTLGNMEIELVKRKVEEEIPIVCSTSNPEPLLGMHIQLKLSIKDKEPELGQVIFSLWNYPEGVYEDNVASFRYKGMEKCLTHWMALPEPPKVAKR